MKGNLTGPPVTGTDVTTRRKETKKRYASITGKDLDLRRRESLQVHDAYLRLLKLPERKDPSEEKNPS